ARIADVDREPLQTFDGFTDVLPSDGRCNHLLYIRKAQAEAGRLQTIDPNFDVPAAAHALSVSGSRAGDLLDGRLDLLADRVNHPKIRARNLDADRALDAGREHVDAVADGLHP